MPSFKGEYEHSVDNKGRVSFPAKLRKAINPEAQDRFTILRGLERCLYLYPEDQWRHVELKLSQVNSYKKKNRIVLRTFLRTAQDLTLDNQNRIALPASLAEWADITDKAVFIGSIDRIEIWDPRQLAKEDAELADEDYEQLFETVMADV